MFFDDVNLWPSISKKKEVLSFTDCRVPRSENDVLHIRAHHALDIMNGDPSNTHPPGQYNTIQYNTILLGPSITWVLW